MGERVGIEGGGDERGRGEAEAEQTSDVLGLQRRVGLGQGEEGEVGEVVGREGDGRGRDLSVDGRGAVVQGELGCVCGFDAGRRGLDPD